MPAERDENVLLEWGEKTNGVPRRKRKLGRGRNRRGRGMSGVGKTAAVEGGWKGSIMFPDEALMNKYTIINRYNAINLSIRNTIIRSINVCIYIIRQCSFEEHKLENNYTFFSTVVQ